jgi:hypothetical protein
VDRLKAFCFTASSAVHAWEFVYDLQKWAVVISSISRLLSVTINEQFVSSWCGILQSDVYFCTDTYLLESAGKHFLLNFVMKELPAEKQFTIW